MPNAMATANGNWERLSLLFGDNGFQDATVFPVLVLLFLGGDVLVKRCNRWQIACGGGLLGCPNKRRCLLYKRLVLLQNWHQNRGVNCLRGGKIP